MTNVFGKTSRGHLEKVHPDLVKIHEKALEIIDHLIEDGIRTVEEQRKNVGKGVSKTMDSLHLPQEDGTSHATDCRPYPSDWSKLQRGLDALKAADPEMQLARFYYLNGVIKAVAHYEKIPIRQGIDWDGDTHLGDQTFIDLGHTELRDK